MDWVKIFESEEEARSKIQEHKPRLLILYGKRICLAMHHGEFFAVQDSCPHNSESLSKGWINHVGEVVCPWHNYRFELHSGKAFNSSCKDLITYTVRIDKTGFFLGL